MSKWWWCVDHKRVEGQDGCGPSHWLGPYDTEAEAGRALDKVAERNVAWDNDPNWSDD